MMWDVTWSQYDMIYHSMRWDKKWVRMRQDSWGKGDLLWMNFEADCFNIDNSKIRFLVTYEWILER